MRTAMSTARLQFRDFVPNDFDAVHAYASDPQVTQFTSFGPNTEADTREFLGRVAIEAAASPRRNYTLAIVESASGRLIGACGLDRVDAVGPQFVLGYCLDTRYWRRGYASEAVRRLVAFGFADLGAWRICAHVFVGNDASARLLRRLGFRLEGTHRQCVRARGAWHDAMTFAMLAAEWKT